VRRLIVGCGYLGERVARAWRDSGDTVYATTRGPRAGVLANAGLHPVIVDVCAGQALSALPPTDTVVFAVGGARQSASTGCDTQVDGLRAVLDALPESTGRVIYVSSTGVYAQDAGEWVDEASVCAPASASGRSCLAAEQVLFAHPRGGDALVLRLAGLYGPGRVPRSADVRAGRTIAGSPDAYLNLIHVDDAARAVLAAAAATQAVSRTYVVSDGNPPTRGEYVGLLASRLGVAPPAFEGGTARGKRVCNARAIRELALQLTYPSYREGLAGLRE
jgi:nucleoside-diphosphate-sugar epimerase